MKSYVIVGLGGRSTMFVDALCNRYRQIAELVAICDSNYGRLQLAAEKIRKYWPNVATYISSDFDKMISEYKPDSVIVCTRDKEHSDYICRSLDFGCDVITEKPMTIDHKKCQQIVDTVKRTGKSVRVTFNYRYSPPRTQMKQLLMSGIIGDVLSINFQWNLDTNHGADYFRRWHRFKENSGGLMVHKATHHFDLMNWWLGSVPETVFARGGRLFYNEKQAAKYGLAEHGTRCLNCPVASKCNFYLDMNAFDAIKSLYLDNENYDQYHRDRCVFGNDITIEDNMNVLVNYRSGAIMNYSLNAFLPWEGYRVELNGTKGRLEHWCRESSYINGDGTVQGGLDTNNLGIMIYPHFKTPYAIKVEEGEGAHGGGDDVMLEDIFGVSVPDPYKRCADYVQGAYSILVGIAANISMVESKLIRIADIVTGLSNPGYAQNDPDDKHIPFTPAAKCIARDGQQINANVPLTLK